MSDIINRANRLLEGSTPGPWMPNPHGNILAGRNGETPSLEGKYDPLKEQWIAQFRIQSDSQEQDFRNARMAAAAPELAQALAEETWEYAVQVKIGAKWLFLGKGFGGHNFAKNACWFEKKEKAQWYQLIHQGTAPTRIVRRRVSPVEVVDA